MSNTNVILSYLEANVANAKTKPLRAFAEEQLRFFKEIGELQRDTEQSQEPMNTRPTPETDHLESNLGNAAHPVLSSFCRKLERERDEARAESIRWQSIAEGRGRTDVEQSTHRRDRATRQASGGGQCSNHTDRSQGQIQHHASL
jgi:hypothetical protein